MFEGFGEVVSISAYTYTLPMTERHRPSVDILQIEQIGSTVCIFLENWCGGIITIFLLNGFRTAALIPLSPNRTHIHVLSKSRVIAQTDHLDARISEDAQGFVEVGVCGLGISACVGRGCDNHYGRRLNLPWLSVRTRYSVSYGR